MSGESGISAHIKVIAGQPPMAMCSCSVVTNVGARTMELRLRPAYVFGVDMMKKPRVSDGTQEAHVLQASRY